MDPKLVSNFFFLTIPILPFAGIDSGPRNRKDPFFFFFFKRNHLSVRSNLSKLKLKTKLEEKGKKKKDQLGLAEILGRKQAPQDP